jgi:hypothetical protein
MRNKTMFHLFQYNRTNVCKPKDISANVLLHAYYVCVCVMLRAVIDGRPILIGFLVRENQYILAFGFFQ